MRRLWQRFNVIFFQTHFSFTIFFFLHLEILLFVDLFIGNVSADQDYYFIFLLFLERLCCFLGRIQHLFNFCFCDRKVTVVLKWVFRCWFFQQTQRRWNLFILIKACFKNKNTQFYCLKKIYNSFAANAPYITCDRSNLPSRFLQEGFSEDFTHRILS